MKLEFWPLSSMSLTASHPNMISYKEAFFSTNTEALCIIMEYADGGDLYEKINKHKSARTFFEEAEIWETFIQIVKGLQHLHEMKILH